MQRHITQLSERLEKAEALAAQTQQLGQENASLKTETNLLREQLQKTTEELKQSRDDIQRLSREVGQVHGQAYVEGYKEGLREQGNPPAKDSQQPTSQS